MVPRRPRGGFHGPGPDPVTGRRRCQPCSHERKAARTGFVVTAAASHCEDAAIIGRRGGAMAVSPGARGQEGCSKTPARKHAVERMQRARINLRSSRAGGGTSRHGGGGRTSARISTAKMSSQLLPSDSNATASSSAFIPASSSLSSSKPLLSASRPVNTASTRPHSSPRRSCHRDPSAGTSAPPSPSASPSMLLIIWAYVSAAHQVRTPAPAVAG